MKVDDWAVCTENTEGQFTAGKAYKVRYVTTETVGVYEDDGSRENGWCREYFEPWQPKVGDRVRYSDECNEYWWFGPHTENKEGVIRLDRGADYDFEDGRFEVRTADSFGIVGLKHIEPLPVAEQPAALKIEAGKFYRTRDGRKVGPMVAFYDDGRCFASSGTMNGDLWNPDGSAWFTGAEDSPVLIAEWVDETPVAPATPVAATASNDNAPAKLKVGDVVRLKCDGYAAEVGATAKIREVRSDGMIDVEWVRNELRNGQSDGGYYPDSFEVATVAPQQSATTAGFTIPLFDTDGAKLVKTKNGYGFEIARFGNYAWVDTGQTAPITLKVADIAP